MVFWDGGLYWNCVFYRREKEGVWEMTKLPLWPCGPDGLGIGETDYLNGRMATHNCHFRDNLVTNTIKN
ncbi:hypothetical protein M8C21_027304 [Ambrosia artemisiifolia]|uniref:Uncharacterized protein n=1 Tax=Ambrosia artemisiifolia TaxID=4212 RepID=A0AAD5BXH1_AMBAR|nr:hypothetical protein M8C21_027304 [Ambrosia artemisiifolia]